MSQLVSPAKVLLDAGKHFDTQNNYGLKFESECLFAKQQVTKSGFSLKVAQENPESLKSAILNVAAIGISLNPATAHAYLVPRDKAICLDISYRGLVKLATDSGAIEWAKSELVYEGDDFDWLGFHQIPHHKFNPFDEDRMKLEDPFDGLLGGYCVAKLATGEYMIDRMTRSELEKIRDTSKANNGPWKAEFKDKYGNKHKGWPEEMLKKALVKRASKSWPQSAGRDRIDNAIHVLNQHEGLQETLPVDEDRIEQFLGLVATGASMHVLSFMTNADDELQAACYNTAPQGEKTKFKQRVTGLLNDARETVSVYVTEITELAESGDPAAIEYYDELDDVGRKLVDAALTDITHRQIAELRKQAA